MFTLFYAIRRFFSQKWYWLKCAVWHHYNVVKVKTLPPTWNDRDELMLHACFQILCDFIEKEKPFDEIVWDFEAEIALAEKSGNVAEILACKERDATLKFTKSEMKDLYLWWTKQYPEQKQNDLLRDKLYEEEQKQLHRLLALRSYFWT